MTSLVTATATTDRHEHPHRPGKSRRVGRVGVNWHEKPLLGTGQQPVHKTFVLWRLTTNQAAFSAIDSLDLKFLPRFNAVLLPNFRRENDLALARYSRRHGGKMPS